MKTTSVHVLLLLSVVTVFISCRKKIDIAASRAQLLTQESWAYDQLGIDQNHDGQIDEPETVEDCAQDDLITFNANGIGSFHQGAVLCYPSSPVSQSFEWSLQNNDSQIEYGGTVHNIIELNETELSIYTEESDGVSTVRHILTYKR
jgi:hypothetical protein